MKLILTGECGFIGSAAIRHVIRARDHVVVNVGKRTYATSEDALEEARLHPHHILVRVDITDGSAMRQIFETYSPDAVMHLAAESHVDRSIDGPALFIQSNVVGTSVLLEVARAYWAALDSAKKAGFKFHHVSTDEVSGALGHDDPPFTETTSYAPRSPYSASKAASDHPVRAWQHTYGLPTLVSNTVNNYGPWQFPEKLIPLVTLNALEGRELPVYGDGSNMRDWLFVESELDRKRPGPAGSRERMIRVVTDRPGHDFRYEMDPSRSEQALEWKASHDFDAGLARTVDWYLSNQNWWKVLRAGTYAGHRLGTGARVDA